MGQAEQTGLPGGLWSAGGPFQNGPCHELSTLSKEQQKMMLEQKPKQMEQGQPEKK